MSKFPSKAKFKHYTARRVPSIKDIMNISNDEDDFLDKISQFSARIINKIEKLTIGQANNVLWFKYRKHCITASIAHRVANAERKADECFRVRALIAKELHIPLYVPAMVYGQNSEAKAIQTYVETYKSEHTNLRCLRKGLKLYEDIPYLGASVDGILVCDCHESFLVEVKCPYSLRDKSIIEYGNKLIYLTPDLQLRKTHPYWDQVQMGLGVYGLQKGKFIVWSQVDFLSIEIDFDEVFFSVLINNLSNYYQTKYLPHIIWG